MKTIEVDVKKIMTMILNNDTNELGFRLMEMVGDNIKDVDTEEIIGEALENEFSGYDADDEEITDFIEQLEEDFENKTGVRL